ncbi:MAG: CpaD family pilus assembly lipoprotein, partial [Alphaproteobacteria bacterium]
MQNAHLPLWKKIRTSVAIGAVIALGACTKADMSFENFGTSDPDRVPEAANSPQDNYPILVEARRSSVNLPGRNGTDRLTASEIRRVDEIVTAYIANARGQLVISVPGAAATEPLVLGRAKQIADHAKRRGLPPSRILLRVDTE